MFVLATVSELQIKAGTIPGETSQQYWEEWRESERNGKGWGVTLKNVSPKGGKMMAGKLRHKCQMELRYKDQSWLSLQFGFLVSGVNLKGWAGGALRSHRHYFQHLDDQAGGFASTS